MGEELERSGCRHSSVTYGSGDIGPAFWNLTSRSYSVVKLDACCKMSIPKLIPSAFSRPSSQSWNCCVLIPLSALAQT